MGVVSAVGVAVGRADREKTPRQIQLQADLLATIGVGQAAGEDDQQIGARIDAILRG